MEGMSMSELILREMGKALDRPMRQEVLDRIRAQPDRSLSPSPPEVIRDERDSR